MNVSIQTQPPPLARDRRDRILDGVTVATDLLMDDRPWREALPDVLGVLGRASVVSRVYFFDLHGRPEGQVLATQTAEWVGEGVEPQIDNPELQDLDMHEAGFGRWLELLRAGDPVVGNIADFPDSERPILEAQDIKSLLVQPVLAGEELVGLIGFDACESVHHWKTIEVRVLRIAARVLGAAMHRERREQAWRRTERMAALGRMASGVAHDFNNLLAVVSASSQLARIGLDGGESACRSARASLDTTDRAVDQAASLVRRLLEFGRGSRGTAEEIAIPEVLADMRPLIEQAAGPNTRVRIRSIPRVGVVRMDPFQFRQVILNLAGNARDAMPDGGTLDIEVSEIAAGASGSQGDGSRGCTERVLVTVSDDGTGVPRSIRDRIFDPFFSTKPAEQGTGLGLATAYGSVTAAGGRLFLVDDDRKGTTFRIELPVAAGPDDGPEVADSR